MYHPRGYHSQAYYKHTYPSILNFKTLCVILSKLPLQFSIIALSIQSSWHNTLHNHELVALGIELDLVKGLSSDLPGNYKEQELTLPYEEDNRLCGLGGLTFITFGKTMPHRRLVNIMGRSEYLLCLSISSYDMTRMEMIEMRMCFKCICYREICIAMKQRLRKGEK